MWLYLICLFNVLCSWKDIQIDVIKVNLGTPCVIVNSGKEVQVAILRGREEEEALMARDLDVKIHACII